MASGRMALDLDLDYISELGDDGGRTSPGCTPLLVNSHPTHAQTSKRKNHFHLSSNLWFNYYCPGGQELPGKREGAGR